MGDHSGFNELNNSEVNHSGLAQAIADAKKSRAEITTTGTITEDTQRSISQGGTINYGSDEHNLPWKWIIAVVIIVAVYMFYNSENSGSTYTSTSNTSNSTRQQQAYERPLPVGMRGEDHILTEGELRWILKREIVIETMRPYLRSERSYREFNALVDDFNRRSRGRYYRRTYERVKREIEEQRSSIESEAVCLVTSWN